MQFLNQPYPLNTSINSKIISSVIIGVFVFGFLLVFQPFGLSEWNTDFKLLKLLGYGVITMFILFILSVIIPALLKSYFSEKKWVIWKEATWLLFMIFCISVGNFIYSIWLGIANYSVNSLFFYGLATLVIGVFPNTFYIVINYNRLLKKNSQNADNLNSLLNHNQIIEENVNQNDKVFQLIAENGKTKFAISIDNLIFIMSADNYINICYLRDNTLTNELFRVSLKSTLEQTGHFKELIKCHRSYLINLNQVLNVEGNSQGLKIKMKFSDEIIPVSRNLNTTIKEKIQTLHSKN